MKLLSSNLSYQFPVFLLIFYFSSALCQADSRIQITEENIESFSGLIINKGVGYNTACYYKNVKQIVLGKPAALELGTVWTVLNEFQYQKRKQQLKQSIKKSSGAARRKRKLKLKSLVQAWNSCGVLGGDQNPTTTRLGPGADSIGTNIGWVNGWDAEIKFVDLMLHAREWVARGISSYDWDLGQLALRADGYPTEIPQKVAGQAAEAITVFGLADMGASLPAGLYTFSFSGTGKVKVAGEGLKDQIYTEAGTYKIAYSPDREGIWITILESDASNPIRDMHFILPGYSSVNDRESFYAPFIDYLDDFTVVRVMQTMNTNGGQYSCDNEVEATDRSCVKSWENRPKKDYFTQATAKGMSLEYLVHLANQASVDLWISIPHGADDEYIRNMANYIFANLNSHLRVYVENSNEVWNYGYEYPQSRWARNNGVYLNLSSDPFLAGLLFHAKTTVKIIQLFKEEWASSPERVVGVLGGWLGNAWSTAQMLSYISKSTVNPDGVMPDAVATGPYVGIWILPAISGAGLTSSTSVNQILDWMIQNITEKLDNPNEVEDEESLKSLLDEQKKIIVDQYGLLHIAYEGGQHLDSLQGYNTPEALANLGIAANRHQRMADVYDLLLKTWSKSGGKLFVQYSGIQGCNVTQSCFGIKEAYGSSLEDSPKYRAVLERQQELTGQ